MNDPEAETIKRTTDIVAIVEKSVALRRSGRQYVGFCPFHDNVRTPSFVVWPDTGTWRCFGACNNGGDVIAFVMKRDGCDYKQAKETLRGNVHPALTKPLLPTPRREERTGPPPADWQASAERVIDRCQSVLWDEAYDRARAWLNARGLNDETLKRWRIGYNPGPLAEKGCEIAGLWVPFGITIPCIVGSAIWYVKVRRPAGDPKYLQIKGGRPALFGAETLTAHDRAVFVEGEFDAMLLEQEAGDLIGVATMGAQGYRISLSDWSSYLLHLSRLFIAYDTDGKSEGGAGAMMTMTRRARRVSVPMGKDVTEYWQAGGDLCAWSSTVIGGDVAWPCVIVWPADTKVAMPAGKWRRLDTGEIEATYATPYELEMAMACVSGSDDGQGNL